MSVDESIPQETSSETEQLEQIYSEWFTQVFPEQRPATETEPGAEGRIPRHLKLFAFEADASQLAQKRLLEELGGYLALIALDSADTHPLAAYNRSQAAILAATKNINRAGSDTEILNTLLDVAIKAAEPEQEPSPRFSQAAGNPGTIIETEWSRRPKKAPLFKPVAGSRVEDRRLALLQSVDATEAEKQIALQSIMDQYTNSLTGYVKRIVGSRVLAEEIVLETFTATWFSIGRYAFDEPNGLKPLLYKVAHNKALNEIRRKSFSMASVHELTEITDATSIVAGSTPNGDPVRTLEAKENLAAKVDEFKTLPESQKAAFRLSLQGLAYADIAEILGVTVPSVKSLLVRARTNLINFAALPDPQRAAHCLKRQNKSYNEIADALGTTVDEAKSLVKNAKSKLKELEER